MVGNWVLTAACIFTALAMRFSRRWQAVHRPVPEYEAPAQLRVLLDPVPEAAAAALEPYNLEGAGFTCLGIFGSSKAAQPDRGGQVWLDATGTIVGFVVYDARGSLAVTCRLHFVSYLGTEHDRFGIVVSSHAVPQLLRYSRSGRRPLSAPGRSPYELLLLHRRQRAAQGAKTFVRFDSMADLDRVQDEVHSLNRQWLLDNRILVRRSDGQLWLNWRVTLVAVLVSMPLKRMRQWVSRLRAARQIRALPPIATSDGSA